MATLSDSLVSSSARRLPIRVRPDLSARKQQYLGQSYWVVKDPVGLNYYRFQEEEYAILYMLDGTTSLDEVKDRFEAEFPPQKITLEELQNFLGMLHRSGLVIADVPGQGRQLRKRRDDRRRKEMLAAASNILCIRFKGFDPERILNWLYPKVRWFFSPTAFILSLLLCLAALTLVVVEFDVFRSKLPSFYQFFSPTNALLLAAVLGCTKVFHEFGHGLSCKHFGGECHEIGVMILVLTPCLYCNVSDSWMLPSKWKRAAIGAAGMYVEVVLAAVAAFVWWFTEPGLLYYVCLNIMFISSVSTLLFNANPLLRYDGYYILADLVEIPNLRQKATSILSRKMGHWLLGIEPPEDPFLPQRNQIFFALYSIAAAVYRWFILASILYFMYKIFEPYGLQVIGQAIILMSLYGLVAMPLYKLGKFFYVPGRIEKVQKPRMYTSLAVIGVLLLGLFFIPLPYGVMCTLDIQPRDAEPVYFNVKEGGQLEEVFVKPGDRVVEGQLLARLSNPELDQRIAQLEGDLKAYDTQLQSLQRQRHDDPQAGLQIPGIEDLRAVAKILLEKEKVDREQLELKAPCDGTVLPPPSRKNPPESTGQLPPWSGTPFDEENLGATLERGTLFCHIGDPRQLKAVLVIDVADVEFVKKDMQVSIQLDELPHDTLQGEITALAFANLEVSPRHLSTKAGGELPTVTDPVTGVERPQSASYQAEVPLDDTAGNLRLGLRGRGKIHADWMPLAQRLWRLVQHTFSFKL